MGKRRKSAFADEINKDVQNKKQRTLFEWGGAVLKKAAERLNSEELSQGQAVEANPPRSEEACVNEDNSVSKNHGNRIVKRVDGKRNNSNVFGKDNVKFLTITIITERGFRN